MLYKLTVPVRIYILNVDLLKHSLKTKSKTSLGTFFLLRQGDLLETDVFTFDNLVGFSFTLKCELNQGD
jgi:hypothetical protein